MSPFLVLQQRPHHHHPHPPPTPMPQQHHYHTAAHRLLQDPQLLSRAYLLRRGAQTLRPQSGLTMQNWVNTQFNEAIRQFIRALMDILISTHIVLPQVRPLDGRPMKATAVGIIPPPDLGAEPDLDPTVRRCKTPKSAAVDSINRTAQISDQSTLVGDLLPSLLFWSVPYSTRPICHLVKRSIPDSALHFLGPERRYTITNLRQMRRLQARIMYIT